MPVYNKLVRNRIPDIIANSGKVYEASILSDEEYKIELQKKLIEEVNEYIEARTDEESTMELADVLEVVYSLGSVHGKDAEEIDAVRRKKAMERGSFSDKVFLKSVE